jgi:hypothetical protein
MNTDWGRRAFLRRRQKEEAMKKIGLAMFAIALGLCTGVSAHTLRIECKKTTGETIVCRGVFSDGELARRLPIIIIDDEEKVLSSGTTDVKGEYTFTAPGPEYNVVIEGDRAHTAGISSLDIW